MVHLPTKPLDVNGKVIVEHVWIGGHGHDIRSKCRTYQRDTIPAPGDISEWGYDGSSTNQASGEDSEVFIRPRKVVKCPLRGGMNCIALCDTYLPTGEPANTNFRAEAVKFSICVLKRNHGLPLSKNTSSWIPTQISQLDLLQLDMPSLRDHTTAVKALSTPLAVILWMLITEHAFMQI